MKISTRDVRTINVREIARDTHGLFVGGWIANSQRHRLVAIVDNHRAHVSRCNCFGTWRRDVAARTNRSRLQQERQTNLIFRRRIYRTISVIRERKIGKLQQELTIGVGYVLRQNVGAPTGWTTIEARRHSLAAHENTSFRVTPLGLLRLNDQAGVETGLLMS